MYRPNRLRPPMPAKAIPIRSPINKTTAVRAPVNASSPLFEQGQASMAGDRIVTLGRASTVMYPTSTEACLKVRHRGGQDIVFVKPDTRSNTLPLTWSAVHGHELDHQPVTTETLRKYMQAREYPTAEVNVDDLAHKLAEEKGIRFRRHGRNANVWFATSLRPPTSQPKPKARPWYSIW